MASHLFHRAFVGAVSSSVSSGSRGHGLRGHASRVLASIAALIAVSQSTGQTVPGAVVEVYATPPSPNLLSFGVDGALYAGRDDDPAGSITPTFPTKILQDASWSSYGSAGILDPDSVVVDTVGVVSGVRGALLVGGLLTLPNGPGRVTAIRPDESQFTLFEEVEYDNITELKFDSTGSLLFASLTANKVFISVSGETPTGFFTTGAGPIYLTIGPDELIATSDSDGTVQLNAPDGALVDPSFAQFSGVVSIEYAQGGGFGTDLLAVEAGSGILYSVSASGVTTPIGSGFEGASDLAIGRCGAVFVSMRLRGQVLRISKPPSADINSNGVVDGGDITVVLGNWGSDDCASDLDQDGVVSGSDLTILLGNWGPV